MLVVLRHFLSFCSCTTLKVFRNGVHVCAFILFLAYLLRNRVCMHTRNVNNKYCIVITPVEQVSKYAASRLCLVTETAYYVHTVLTLRLPGVTVGNCLRIFAFYVQCITVAGVSQPSSNVAREIRISQEPQSY